MGENCKASRGNLRCERPHHSDPHHRMRTRRYLRVRAAVRTTVAVLGVMAFVVIGSLDSIALH